MIILIRIFLILPSDEIDVIDANKAYESQILNITEDERSTRSQPDSEFSSSNAQFYKCPFCPKTETYHSNLKNHVAKVHFAKEMSIDKSQKQCYFCGKTFTSRNNLVSHIVLKHQFLKRILSDDDWQKLDKDSCKVQSSMTN